LPPRARPSAVLAIPLLLLAALTVPVDTGAVTYQAVTSTGAAIIPGDTDIGNHCDDCTTTISLPFGVSFYGVNATSANVSSNGNVQFVSNSSTYRPGCLPYEAFEFAILPYFDDLRTDAPGQGIFTGLSGTAPNRVFVIEWRTGYFRRAGSANFEIVFRESSPIISVIYGQTTDHGAFETSGVQAEQGFFSRTGFSCLSPELTPGLQVDYVPVSADVVVRGVDDAVYLNRIGPAGPLGWTAAPGASTVAGPGLAPPNPLYVAVRGVDDGVYLNLLDDRIFDGWIRAPGSTIDTPALEIAPALGIELVVRGADNGVYHNRFTGTEFLGWTALGGATASVPAIVLDQSGLLHAVIRGIDNGIYHNVFANDTGWAGWTPLGGATLDTPAVVLGSANALHVVVRGTDNRLFHQSLAGGVWSGWTDLGGATPSAPALTFDGLTLHLVVRGLDDSIVHNRYSGGTWLGFTPVGGATVDGPALGSNLLELHLVIRGTDDGIYYNHFTAGAWDGWTPLGGSTPSRPAVIGR
jgi:hypothetical protein